MPRGELIRDVIEAITEFDFGIARAAGETGLTSTGATIGTSSYMARYLAVCR